LDLTAGTYKPNATDLEHYHFLVDNEGKIYEGKCKPEDNENCLDGKYAQHTGGGNTGSIGIALCGMAGFTKGNVGKYPLTKKQCETAWKLGADLCKKYNLDVSKKDTIQTHYGFGKRNPRTSSAGKIDITWLPDGTQADSIETLIKNKVHWYYLHT